MKIILHTDPITGIVAITYPAYNDESRDQDLTDDELLSAVFSTIPKERNPRVTEFETLPPRDLFRDAWEDSNGKLGVNMAKARTLHMQEIRTARNQQLRELDIPFMRAVESGNQAAQETIGKQKQMLRDLPETFDIIKGIDSPSQLQGRWPRELLT